MKKQKEDEKADNINIVQNNINIVQSDQKTRIPTRTFTIQQIFVSKIVKGQQESASNIFVHSFTQVPTLTAFYSFPLSAY